MPLALGLALGWGCSAPRPALDLPAAAVVREAPPEPPEDLSSFSGKRAWRQLESLVEIGPRVSGTRGARQAQSYLLDQLSEAGVFAEALPATILWKDEVRELAHVVGVLPGASDEMILLATHYDTHDFADFRFVGANDGASGAALLLELARVLALGEHSYTILFAFLDGESLHEDGTDGREGSLSFAESLQEAGSLEQIRLAVFFNQVADAELTIVRDLRSHRIHREIFWDAALSLGHEKVFSGDLGFATPSGSHEALLSMGVKSVVAIVDDRYGGPTPPGIHSNRESDDLAQCSPGSLAIVGEVALASLLLAEERFARIDRFVSAPLAGMALQAPAEPPSESESEPLKLDPALEAEPEAAPAEFEDAAAPPADS